MSHTLKLPVVKRLSRAASAAWREFSGKGRSDYAGAATHRLLLDWVSQAKLADEEIRGDLKLLRSRARELARNNSYVKRYFRLLKNNVIGPMGITLQGRVKVGRDFDAATNSRIEVAWNDWAKRPVTVDGKLTLRRLEKLLIKTIACDGEAFVRIWTAFPDNRHGIALQPIDAGMVDETLNRARNGSQNEIRMGVEVDTIGRVVGYHLLANLDSYSRHMGRQYEFVPARSMLHLYDPDRVNQTRGVTWLHAVMIPSHMLDAYEESEAVAARIGAAYGGFFMPKDDTGAADLTSETAPAEMQANPGTFQIGPAGHEFQQFRPEHPTAQFGAFVKQLLRKVASGLGVFYNVLANDAEAVTYSTMRSFALIERDDWRDIANDFVDMWRLPLYEVWLDSAMMVGTFPADFSNFGQYLAVEHQSRGWNWIDPEKEAKGAALAVASGLDTLTRIHAEKGRAIEDVFAERAQELAMAKKFGIPLAEASASAAGTPPANGEGGAGTPADEGGAADKDE
jgi:lambda family phage portal protein